MKLCMLALALVLVGCGGAKSTTTPGQSPSCTATLSGAVNGTFDCRPATTAWASSNNTGGFGFTISQPGTTPGITAAIGWPGEPVTGHRRSTDAGARGGVTLTMGTGAGTQVWAATLGGGNAPAGSYDLSFTSISNTIVTSNGKAYTANGTLDATLAPLTGQAGTVTVHVTF